MHAELEAANDSLKAALSERERALSSLRGSEAKVRALLETAAQAIIAVEAGGRIGLVNATAEQMFGYSREEMLGKPIEMLLPERLRRRHRQYRREYFARPVTRPMGIGMELSALRKDGSEFSVEISLSHIEGGDGLLAVAFVSDTTARKQTEAQSHLQAAVAANMGEGVGLVRARDAVIVYANDRYHELLGYEPGELAGRPVTVLNAGDPAEAQATAQKIIRTLHREGVWRGEVHNVRKDGSTLWTRASISTLEDPEHGTVWVGVLNDITERKQAEDALHRSRQELRALSAKLISVSEEERRDLSRELHDVLSHKLAALALKTKLLERRQKALPDEARAELRRLEEEISNVAGEVQQISRQLHPTVLRDLGLEVALREACTVFSNVHGIPVGFSAKDVPRSLPENVALCVYRVAQECLHNVAKHAQATAVDVALVRTEEGLALSVKDSGDGFDVGEARGKGGLGLISMEERLRLVNGRFSVRSRPGEGTVVDVFVPLTRSKA
jgi:two-component system sensor histidine kinase UhpB